LCCLQSVFSRKQIKILCDLFYDLPADHLFTVGVRSKHGVVAKIVDVSRNSLGTLEYEVNSAWSKHLRLLRAGNHQAFRDVPVNFFNVWERMHRASQGHTLF